MRHLRNLLVDGPDHGRLTKMLVPHWIVLVLAVSGCQASPDLGAKLPPAPPEVLIEMEEYHYQYDEPVPSGRVVFRFQNNGEVGHRPALLPLSDDLPPIQEQLRGETRATAAPFAGILPRQPGETGTFAVDLVPGQRYALICLARDSQDRPHATQGMAVEFRALETRG